VISIIAFDFPGKKEQSIDLSQLGSALNEGRFCWVDINGAECAAEEGEECLKRLGINDLARHEVLGPDREGRYDVYDECLHFAVT